MQHVYRITCVSIDVCSVCVCTDLASDAYHVYRCVFVFFFSWQIRRVTVLFVNLGLKEQTLLAAAVYDEAMEEMHRVSRPKQGETRGLR